MAPHTETMKLLRVVVREDFSRDRCQIFLRDLKDAVCGPHDRVKPNNPHLDSCLSSNTWMRPLMWSLTTRPNSIFKKLLRSINEATSTCLPRGPYLRSLIPVPCCGFGTSSSPFVAGIAVMTIIPSKEQQAKLTLYVSWLDNLLRWAEIDGVFSL
jgi:hypothetical protein